MASVLAFWRRFVRGAERFPPLLLGVLFVVRQRWLLLPTCLALSFCASIAEDVIDEAEFCPPLGDDCPNEGCRPMMDYGHILRSHSALLRWLWLASVYAPPELSPRTSPSCSFKGPSSPWEAMADLAETMLRLDCVVGWWPCFSAVGNAVRQLRRLCPVLRDRVNNALVQLVQEDPNIVRHLPRSHLCFWVESDPRSEHGARMLQNHQHIRRLAAARALRALESPASAAITVLPRWAYPSEDSAQGTCPRCDTARGSPPPWWVAPTVAAMLGQMSNASSRQGLFVNLGAREGACEPPGDLDYLPGGEPGDPANCLAASGHGGVVVEGDETHFTTLRQRFADRDDVELHLGWLDPRSARTAVSASVQRLAAKLLKAGTEEDAVDLLKVDVDNCDCCFVEEILAGGVRPRLIHAEVHSLVPPPIAFRPRLREDLSRTSLRIQDGAAHLHCSLSAYLSVLEPLGYSLSHLVSRDAVFVRSDLVHAFPRISSGVVPEEAWKLGYSCHPHVRTKHEEAEYESVFSYDFRRWAHAGLPLAERLQHVERQINCSGLVGYELWVHGSKRAQL